MKRVIKPQGLHNIVVENADIPVISANEILVRAKCSLISRGSEIWHRYNRIEAIEHQKMGYSMSGEVVGVGSSVIEFKPGDRVAAVAPHAEYVSVPVVGDIKYDPIAIRIPDSLSFEAATFWPLTISSVQWMHQLDAEHGDTVVILGQGLVGSICMQVLKTLRDCSVIAIDTLPLRCNLALELGADEVINANKQDAPQHVIAMTNGKGADIVVYTVGGKAGPIAFKQGLDMVKTNGLIQVIGLYEDQPLPLDSRKIQRRRLIGGHLDTLDRGTSASLALDLLISKKIQTDQMISHRYLYKDASDAFALLYNRLEETKGVILVWD